MQELSRYLKLMADKNASDLFFSVGTPANLKGEEGVTRPIGRNPLSSSMVKELAYSTMSEEQLQTFVKDLEMNLGFGIPGIGRFRANIFRQRGEVAMVIRYIKHLIPAIDTLGIPPIARELIMKRSGLILVVGRTGTGKSTTLASMIDYRNTERCGHILTIEDPIEFIYRHKKSVVDQREVGLDTLSYGSALKNALRESPDVIMIGEIRDRETMQYAMSYAEMGHLCLSTLHANNAEQTFERVINFFPRDAHNHILSDLAMNLVAIISQRLIPAKDKGKRVLAAEVLTPTPYIQSLIQQGELDKIKQAMEESSDKHLQTFDQSLYKLYVAGKITIEEALHNADSPSDLKLKIRLSGNGVSAKESPKFSSVEF